MLNGLDWMRCCGVRSGKARGPTVVKDSRVTAAAVVDSYDLGETIEEIVYSFELDPEDIRKVIAFADEHNPLQRFA